MADLDCREFFGSRLEISLAKPPSDKKRKEEMLRARELRMIQTMAEAETAFQPYAVETSPQFDDGPSNRRRLGGAGLAPRRGAGEDFRGRRRGGAHTWDGGCAGGGSWGYPWGFTRGRGSRGGQRQQY